MTWYRDWFNEIYLRVYAHRNVADARQLLELIQNRLLQSSTTWILDCGCGNGRHSLELAKRGYPVIGMDLSPDLLRVAQKAIHKAKLDVPFVRGDMRQLPFRDQVFSTVLSLFTSFGYFDDDENKGVFLEYARVLQPDGTLILDYLNPSYVIAHLVPFDEKHVGKYHVTQRRWVAHHRVEKEITVSDGESVRTFLESVRLYSLPEMQDLFDNVGLTLDEIYGSYTGEPYDPQQSNRMILFAHKS
ncbi:MAG: class I SAM-dependent methyltransferase [Gemmatimonadetes bacterium]|nr:MAG: class I SAM-dependent methyltransferase [Gemmatimonadota bacterium]